MRLGPVGGRIIAETFVVMPLDDPSLFVNEEPTFRPIPALTRGGTFGFAELVNAALAHR